MWSVVFTESACFSFLHYSSLMSDMFPSIPSLTNQMDVHSFALLAPLWFMNYLYEHPIQDTASRRVRVRLTANPQPSALTAQMCDAHLDSGYFRCKHPQVYLWVKSTNAFQRILRFSTNPVPLSCPFRTSSWSSQTPAEMWAPTWTKNVHSSLVFPPFVIMIKVCHDEVAPCEFHGATGSLHFSDCTSTKGASSFKCSHTNCRMSLI